MSSNRNDIHPGVLVVVGLVVAVSSFIINVTQDSNFVIFIVIGAAMASYGIVKFLVLGTSSEGQDSSDANHGSNRIQETSTNPGTKAAMHQPRTMNNNQRMPQYIFCRRCGNKIDPRYNFCPFCGQRQR